MTQQPFPQVVQPIQEAISGLEAELERLTQARKEVKAEIRRHRKALATLNGHGQSKRRAQPKEG